MMLTLMLLMMGTVNAAIIEKVDITYDTSKAILSPALTQGEWAREYCDSVEVGTGTLINNRNTSNYCLDISYDDGVS